MSSNDKDELEFVRGLPSRAHALRETRSFSSPLIKESADACRLCAFAQRQRRGGMTLKLAEDCGIRSPIPCSNIV